MFNFLGGRAVLTGSPADEVALQPVQQLLPAPRSEENQLKDFHRGLEKLNAAIQRSSKTRAHLKDLQNQGSWDSFWGGLSGRNDKDLAISLAEFGECLEVTQSVVQLLTQVHTVNNNVLRGFNDALVREIERLQADTQTLGGNQDGALVVLCEFKHQIDELLALADGYENCRQAMSVLAVSHNNHETELQKLGQAFSSGARMQEQLHAASALQLAKLGQAQEGQQKKIERVTKLLGSEIHARERLSTAMMASLKELSEALDQRLEPAGLKIGELLEKQHQAQVRIEELEAQLLARPSWLRQQALALVAVLLSCAALASILVS